MAGDGSTTAASRDRGADPMNDMQNAADTGATAVEYALMLSLIFAAILASVTLLGTNLVGAFGAAAAML